MTLTPVRFWSLVAVAAATLFTVPALAQQQPFELVVGQLKSPDPRTRLSALKLLAESGYPEAAAPVAPLLSDPDPRIRREALYAELAFFVPSEPSRQRIPPAERAFHANLAAMPGERVPMEVVTGLLTPLKDESAKVRAEAAYALAVLGQVEGVAPDAGYKAVVEALADRLGDPDAAVRAAVARASGRVFRRCPAGCGVVAVERLGDALVRLLNDPSGAVQSAAMEGLGELRYERAVTGLTEALLYYKTGETAWAALDTLARIGHASSVPTFNAALANKDPNFRRSAVEGLARVGGDKASDVIGAAAAVERDGSVTLAMAYGQHRLGRAAEATRIIQALGDKGLRQQAQEYLVEFGPPAAPQVAAGLVSTVPGVRVALLEVLGLTGTPREAALIEALQNDADPAVATAAQRTLSRIRRVLNR